MMITLTKLQARRFMLMHQGLLPPRQLTGKEGVMDYVRRAGCIQFDPLDVVGQNAALVLQSRVAGFRPKHLTELLYEDRWLVDGWDKNQSIYAVDDWPYFQRYRDGMRRYYGHEDQPAVEILPLVREALRERGPLSSIDLEDYGTVVNWVWGPAARSRAALESMYAWGELVIHHRVHTRKFYDFAERHLPAEHLSAPDPYPNDEDYYAWRILRRIGGIGLGWEKDNGGYWLGLGDIRGAERKRNLDRLTAQQVLHEVKVEDLPHTFYIRSQDLPTLDKALVLDEVEPQAVFLAPLDNLIWSRALMGMLFNFAYTWEVYTPASKRVYGWYVLPVLAGDQFVARVEPTFDKKALRLHLQNWWWEAGAAAMPGVKAAIHKALESFCAYLGATGYTVAPQIKEQAPWI